MSTWTDNTTKLKQAKFRPKGKKDQAPTEKTLRLGKSKKMSNFQLICHKIFRSSSYFFYKVE